MGFGLIHADDAPDAAREFVEFASGPEGRRAVEENGYAGP